jgi:pilus assembly protein CpaE
MKLPVVFIGDETTSFASLRQKLANEIDFLIADQHKVYGFAEAGTALGKKAGSALVVANVNEDADMAFRVVEDLKLTLPELHVFMTAANRSPETILQAMRSGAEEFLMQPFDWPEVVQCLERMRQKITLRLVNSRGQHALITVFSSKGGVGSTTVATNLAVALAAVQQPPSTCLVDLALQFGAVTSFLNLTPSYTILELTKSLQRIDSLSLDGSLINHTSGIRVLAEPARAEDASRITAEDIDQTLDILAQSFQFVVVDTPKEITEEVFSALVKAHLILFVIERPVPYLKNAHRALESFERLGIPLHKVRLVLNRHAANKLVSLESIEKTLATKVFWTLPNDYPTAVGALNQGVSILDLKPRSPLAKSYHGLARMMIEELSFAPVGQKKKSGILRRWLPARGTR